MLTDPNLPAEFEAIRDKNERLLWVGRPALIPFLLSGVPLLLFGLCWGAFDYFGFIRHMPRAMAGFAIPFFALHLFPFWASILNVVRLALVHGNTFYAITDKRILIRSGFWGTDFNALDYDNVRDAAVSVGPVENMLGVGTIRVATAGVTARGNSTATSLVAVAHPYDVFKQLKQVSLDAKTDWEYPNAKRPATNPGYTTQYDPKAAGSGGR